MVSDTERPTWGEVSVGGCISVRCMAPPPGVLGCAATTASHSDRCTSLGDRAEPRARRLRSRETSDPVASQTYF
eukprot:scaffold73889_cov61-Phaeocystis_antarctica.AAC.2